MWLLLAGDWRARRKTAAGKAEQVSPQKRKRAGDSLGRPRKAKFCTEINSGVSSGLYELISPLCSSLDGIDLELCLKLTFLLVCFQLYQNRACVQESAEEANNLGHLDF
jgi:hypothetical protein